MLDILDHSGDTFSFDSEPANVILLDDILTRFFKKSLHNEKVDVKIGFAKEGFIVPSVYVSCPSYQYTIPIGGKLTQDRNQRLSVNRIPDKDGGVAKITTDIAVHDPSIIETGMKADANVKISIYNDTYEGLRRLSEKVISILLFNYSYYLKHLHKYDEEIIANPRKDPKITGFTLISSLVDYNLELAGVKNIYAMTIIGIIPFTIKIQNKYTYLTGIREEQTIIEPVTGQELTHIIRET
jgi:hypothetical protein